MGWRGTTGRTTSTASAASNPPTNMCRALTNACSGDLKQVASSNVTNVTNVTMERNANTSLLIETDRHAQFRNALLTIAFGGVLLWTFLQVLTFYPATVWD